MIKDMLNPSAADEKTMHKKARLVQTPNSNFLDIECSNCGTITTVFSHANAIVVCPKEDCGWVLTRPTGGKASVQVTHRYRVKRV